MSAWIIHPATAEYFIILPMNAFRKLMNSDGKHVYKNPAAATTAPPIATNNVNSPISMHFKI